MIRRRLRADADLSTDDNTDDDRRNEDDDDDDAVG